LEVLRELHDQQVGLAVFPELSLTGYSLEDLVMQEPLLEDTEQAIATVVEASRELLPIIVLGAPLRATHRNRLYNCAITIHRAAPARVPPGGPGDADAGPGGARAADPHGGRGQP